MNRLTFCAVVMAAALFSFTAPAIAQTYALPLRGDDLATGDRFKTSNHGSGVQTEGKDIGARRHNSDSSWSQLKEDGADKAVLTNWIAYGKPFYAIAPGFVIACWRNAPENPVGSWHPMVNAERIPSGGNHFWIRQDDGNFVLYAHAKPGSIPSNLCPHNGMYLLETTKVGSNPSVRKGAKVTYGVRIRTGQFLGRIGNSGQTDGPHLHVHMERNGSPVVMSFRRGMTTSFADGNASLKGPWRKLDRGPMPNSDILLWPPRPVGNWTFNGTKGSQFQALYDHMTDSGMMPSQITCQDNGDFYRSTWVPASGEWRARHDMNSVEALTKHAEFVSQGFRRTSNYNCGSVFVMVWRK